MSQTDAGFSFPVSATEFCTDWCSSRKEKVGAVGTGIQFHQGGWGVYDTPTAVVEDIVELSDAFMLYSNLRQ